MDEILSAALTASLTLNKHWAKTWIKIDQQRIRSTRSNRMHIDQLEKDTECVIQSIWGTK